MCEKVRGLTDAEIYTEALVAVQKHGGNLTEMCEVGGMVSNFLLLAKWAKEAGMSMEDYWVKMTADYNEFTEMF